MSKLNIIKNDALSNTITYNKLEYGEIFTLDYTDEFITSKLINPFSSTELCIKTDTSIFVLLSNGRMVSASHFAQYPDIVNVIKCQGKLEYK